MRAGSYSSRLNLLANVRHEIGEFLPIMIHSMTLLRPAGGSSVAARLLDRSPLIGPSYENAACTTYSRLFVYPALEGDDDTLVTAESLRIEGDMDTI